MNANLDIAPAQTRELLHELREHLLDRVTLAYAENLKAAKQDLAQLVLRASDPDRRACYEAANTLLINDASELLRDFRRLFEGDYETAIANLHGNESKPWETVGELSLVDTDEFERDLAIDRLAAKAVYSCSQQLTALDRRVGAMLHLKRLDSDRNPISVKRLFRAFVQAADACSGTKQLALILLETFQHYTSNDLPDIYRQLNQHLADNGVLTTMPVLFEDSDLEIKSRTRDSATSSGGGDIFTRLINGISGGRGTTAHSLGGAFRSDGADAAEIGAGGFSAGVPGQMGTMVLGQLVDCLTGLQRGDSQSAADLGIKFDDFDPSSSAALHSLAGSPLLRLLKPTDGMTVDLVARLFDCIFADPEVPPSLQTELGRLQVPILKVALTNKAFFSDQGHPARQLMDIIATAARGWGKGGDQQLLDAVHSSVKQVVDEFESDTSVFRAQSEHLERILREADDHARQNVSELVQRLEQRDRNVVAPSVVADQIAQHLIGEKIPPAVDAFINDTWRDLLIRIYINYGEKSEPWQRALRTLSDLIWSVQPKVVPAERQRLMNLLPDLLRRLPEGMAQIGRSEAWDPFLQDLMQLHMRAIKPNAQQPKGTAEPDARPAPSTTANAEAPPKTQTDAQRGMPGRSSDHRTADTIAAGNPTSAKTPSEAAPGTEPNSKTTPGIGDPDAFTDAARQIEVGDWIELSGIDGSSMTLRAIWVSHHSGLSLFADRHGRNQQILRLEVLAQHLRRSNARILSRDPLTHRAVEQLLTAASPKPSRDEAKKCRTP